MSEGLCECKGVSVLYECTYKCMCVHMQVFICLHMCECKGVNMRAQCIHTSMSVYSQVPACVSSMDQCSRWLIKGRGCSKTLEVDILQHQ